MPNMPSPSPDGATSPEGRGFKRCDFKRAAGASPRPTEKGHYFGE